MRLRPRRAASPNPRAVTRLPGARSLRGTRRARRRWRRCCRGMETRRNTKRDTGRGDESRGHLAVGSQERRRGEGSRRDRESGRRERIGKCKTDNRQYKTDRAEKRAAGAKPSGETGRMVNWSTRQLGKDVREAQTSGQRAERKRAEGKTAGGQCKRWGGGGEGEEAGRRKGTGIFRLTEVPLRVHITAPNPKGVPWGCGAVGSAPDWQSGGQGFESPQLHHKKPEPRAIVAPVLGFVLQGGQGRPGESFGLNLPPVPAARV